MNIDPNSIAYEVYSAVDLEPHKTQEFVLEITLLLRAFDRFLESDMQDCETTRAISLHNFSYSTESMDSIRKDVYDVIADMLSGTVFILARDTETEEPIGIGSLCALPEDPKIGELSDAFIQPEYRRHGIYAELIKQREELARNLGLTSLIVLPLSDGKSRRVLERNGYTVEEQDGQVCMTKDLGGSIGESMNGNYGQRR